MVTGASVSCGELDEGLERCRRVHAGGLGLRHHAMATLLLMRVGWVSCRWVYHQGPHRMIELAGVVDGGARSIFVGTRRATARTILAGASHGALPEQASAA